MKVRELEASIAVGVVLSIGPVFVCLWCEGNGLDMFEGEDEFAGSSGVGVGDGEYEECTGGVAYGAVLVSCRALELLVPHVDVSEESLESVSRVLRSVTAEMRGGKDLLVQHNRL